MRSHKDLDSHIRLFPAGLLELKTVRDRKQIVINTYNPSNGVTFKQEGKDPDVYRKATKDDFASYKQALYALRPDSVSPLGADEGLETAPAEETHSAQDVNLIEMLDGLLIKFQQAGIEKFIKGKLREARSTSPVYIDESEQAEHLDVIKEFIRQFTAVFGG